VVAAGFSLRKTAQPKGCGYQVAVIIGVICSAGACPPQAKVCDYSL